MPAAKATIICFALSFLLSGSLLSWSTVSATKAFAFSLILSPRFVLLSLTAHIIPLAIKLVKHFL
nr:MAG TPA: hypothetical protein [Caudoviricetes sp.]